MYRYLKLITYKLVIVKKTVVMKNKPLKQNDSVFSETEKRLKKESELVKSDSLAVLKEFENID